MSVVDVRKRVRESSGCERRRRRTCVSGEGAENGLAEDCEAEQQVKGSNTERVAEAFKTVTEMVNSEQHQQKWVSKLNQNKHN
jgi:hypothetical protein